MEIVLETYVGIDRSESIWMPRWRTEDVDAGQFTDLIMSDDGGDTMCNRSSQSSHH